MSARDRGSRRLAADPPSSAAGPFKSSITMTVISRLIPGVGRVHAQVPVFAAAWNAANAAALNGPGDLWVALGDSMSQGIGAQQISGGWAGQLHARLTAAGQSVRLVNRSVTGARVHDVLDDQLPRLRQIGLEPALVTVLVGVNDMIFRRRRATAVAAFAKLLDALPAQQTVIGTLPRRNPEALSINAMIDSAQKAGRVRVAELRGGSLRSIRGTLAEDHFHPNERGYAGRDSPLVGKELPVECHDHAVASRVSHPADIQPEVDGAHDAVTELFVDEFFDRRAVHLKHLIEPVHRRIRRHGATQGPPGGLQLQSLPDVVIKIQHGRRRASFGLGHGLLPEQGGRRPGERPSHRLGKLRPRHAQPCFGRAYLRGGLILGHRHIPPHDVLLFRPDSHPVLPGPGRPPSETSWHDPVSAAEGVNPG
jgi:lysophospholipase L1-like esterase